VTVYALSPANTKCTTADPTCLAPPRLVAQGRTDGAGHLPILLPADIQRPPGYR
jgi:hypothetical protein